VLRRELALTWFLQVEASPSSSIAFVTMLVLGGRSADDSRSHACGDPATALGSGDVDLGSGGDKQMVWDRMGSSGYVDLLEERAP
jgi:hypothetical protein